MTQQSFDKLLSGVARGGAFCIVLVLVLWGVRDLAKSLGGRFLDQQEKQVDQQGQLIRSAVQAQDRFGNAMDEQTKAMGTLIRGQEQILHELETDQ